MCKVFLSTADLISILGCSRTKAKQVKKAVNDEAMRRGLSVVSVKLCSAQLFEDMYIKKVLPTSK